MVARRGGGAGELRDRGLQKGDAGVKRGELAGLESVRRGVRRGDVALLREAERLARVVQLALGEGLAALCALRRVYSRGVLLREGGDAVRGASTVFPEQALELGGGALRGAASL